MADNGPITYTIIRLLVITVSTVPTPFPTQKARLSLRRFWGNHSEIKDFGGCRGGGYLTGNWRGVNLQIICTKTHIIVKNCQNWITEFKQFTMNTVIIHPDSELLKVIPSQKFESYTSNHDFNKLRLTRKHGDWGRRECSLHFTAAVLLVGSQESTVAA